MATETSSAGDKLVIFDAGERHELIIRIRQSEPKLAGEVLAELAVATVGAWLRAWRAIKSETWTVGDVPSPEMKYDVRSQAEPYVTVFNKNWDGFSITVHSHDNGQDAVTAAAAFYTMKDILADKMPQLFQAPKPATQAPAIAPKRDIEDVDSFLNDTSANNPIDMIEQRKAEPDSLPFRKFKQAAPNIITIQEFKKGGGGADEYKKMATLATLPYHKTNPQYDDNTMIYIPITNAIKIVEGQYGIQGVIPTEKGYIYIDMKNKDGQESPDWHNFSQDLGDYYSPLMNNEISQFFAPNCIVVLRVGATNGGKQYKNFHKIYQPFAVAAKA